MKRIGGVLLSDIQVQERQRSFPKSYFFVPVNKNASPDTPVPSITFKIDWRSLLRDSITNRARHGKVTIVVRTVVGRYIRSRPVGMMKFNILVRVTYTMSNSIIWVGHMTSHISITCMIHFLQ
jgi:hypothetical protein